MLTISAEKVCDIATKARLFDVKEAATELTDEDSLTTDEFFEVLEDREDDPALDELVAALKSLNQDELLDVAALAWIGRGDFTSDQLEEARASAEEMGRKALIRQLVTIPLLGDYLEEGLNAFGESCL